MSVKSVTPVIRTGDAVPADQFYGDFLRLDLISDDDGVVVYGTPNGAQPQTVIHARPDGEEPAPDLIVEVTNIDRMYQRARQMGLDCLTGMLSQDGPDRFSVRDPFGKTVRIIATVT